jgi:hypothetical protein
MSMRSRLVWLLLRAYPPEWRREYGPELAEILDRRSFGGGAIADVLWSAVRQRVKSDTPATLCGFTAILVLSIGLVLNVAGVPAIGRLLPSLLQDSWKLFPKVVATPFETELYVLWLLTCGCWTVLRANPHASKPGVAAMKVTALAGIPIMVAGLLMLLGVLDVAVATPGVPPSSFHEHGLTYTYYTTQHYRPSPLAVLIAPIVELPKSWIWGAVGGRIGRSILRSRAVRNA